MAPIAADYLHLASKSPSSFAVVNEATAVCSTSCLFTFNESLSPTLENSTVIDEGSGPTIHLYGTKLLPINDSSVGDIRVYIRRSNVSAVTDVLAVEPCTVGQADYQSLVCALRPIPAGDHTVHVIVPGRGATNNLTQTFGLVVNLWLGQACIIHMLE